MLASSTSGRDSRSTTGPASSQPNCPGSVNLRRPEASYTRPVSKSPASCAISVTARTAAFTGEDAVPAVYTISLLAGKVCGSKARAPTVGTGWPREKSLSTSRMPFARKLSHRSRSTGSARLSWLMVGSSGSVRSMTAQTWRSTSSQPPWSTDSSGVFPAEEPLNSFRVLNQSSGSTVDFPLVMLSAGQKRQRTRSMTRRAPWGESSSPTEAQISRMSMSCWPKSASASDQVARVKFPSSAQKLK